MSFSIVPISSFDKDLKKLAKKYPSLKQDYANLLNEIEIDHKLGTPIGKNCYKIRMSISSKAKGKSGGARVITPLIIKVEDEILYLLKIYDKAEQENITEAELKYLLQSISI